MIDVGEPPAATLTLSLTKKMKTERINKKVIDEAIREAYMKADHLVDFPECFRFDCNGFSVTLESTSGSSLSKPMQKFIQNLLKVNMEGPYGIEWPKEEKVKYKEMLEADAMYIVGRLDERDHPTQEIISDRLHHEMECHNFWKSPEVSFAQYRFVVEEGFPVLYVYELQLEKSVQGKGLGKFLMQLLERIACKNKMKAIMLTVQKRNTRAMDFYMKKLCYKVSSHSPSKVDPVVWADCSYEILCKTFDSDAKLKFEDVSHQ